MPMPGQHGVLDFLLIRGRDKEALDLYQRAISNREAVNPDDLFLMQSLEQRGVVLEKMGHNQEPRRHSCEC
jgi:hypothetical protein